MAYRTTKLLSTAAKTRTTQRIPLSRAGTSVSEMSTLELGTSLKSDFCNDWESTRLPHHRSQNSELSTCLPTLPERAYVSGWVPFPQSLPRCQTLDAVRSPVLVLPHSTSDLCGVEVVLGTSNNTAHQTKEAQNPLSPQLNLIDFDEEYNEQVAALPTPWLGLGLSLIDIQTVADDSTAQIKSDAVQDVPLQVGISLLDSTSGTKLSNHVSLDPVPAPLQLQSPLLTPTLPTLVLTSAPFKPTPDVKPEQCDHVSQLASPPATPTLFLTAPSIHCGLGMSDEGVVDRDVDEELESWSDVFGFQEYEDDEDLLDRASCCLLEDFPSPPELPAQCSILDIPRYASINRDLDSESSVRGKSVTSPQAIDHDHIVDEVEGNVEEVPFDYAAFRERLAAFLKDVNNQKMVPTVPVEDTYENASVTISDLPASSSSPQFDYEKLRTRRRSQTLLSHKPVPQAVPMRVSPRPLPLPTEFPPLLGRAVDRSRRQASP